MKGISCQCVSTMYIFDLWMNNEFIYNRKFINIMIYINQKNRFLISYQMC